MGFFKDIGKKIKRVVSLKNAINVATGQWTAVGKDVIRVATTNAPNKVGEVQLPILDNTTMVGKAMQGSVITSQMDAVLTAKGNEFAQKTAEIVGITPQATGVSDWFTKAYLSGMWLRYKNYILIVIAIILGLFAWKHFAKPKRGRVRR